MFDGNLFDVVVQCSRAASLRCAFGGGNRTASVGKRVENVVNYAVTGYLGALRCGGPWDRSSHAESWCDVGGCWNVGYHEQHVCLGRVVGKFGHSVLIVVSVNAHHRCVGDFGSIAGVLQAGCLVSPINGRRL